MQQKSKSGILLNENFRDSLIIDKYSSDISNWRDKKLDHLRSENSEDAITWNIFKSLKQIDPQLWLPQLFKQTFHQEMTYLTDFIDIQLWKKLNSPLSLSVPEGPSEIDIIIESEDFVWFIEAKYKSDVSLNTKHGTNRNRVIRNIDVGIEYAKGKDFYFSLLILDESHSPKGIHITNEYSKSFNLIKEHLHHRTDSFDNLKGVGLSTWFDVLQIFEMTISTVDSDLERYIATHAHSWLREKITKPTKPKNAAIPDETRKYRYSLTRVWNPYKEKVVFIGLNPSTADGSADDPTLKRCIDFAKRWHDGKYGWLEMVNLFAYRATDFSAVKDVDDLIGKDNDYYILNAVKEVSLVVVAWGEKGTYKKRNREVLRILNDSKTPIYCLEILKGGQPKHPLFARADVSPKVYI